MPCSCVDDDIAVDAGEERVEELAGGEDEDAEVLGQPIVKCHPTTPRPILHLADVVVAVEERPKRLRLDPAMGGNFAHCGTNLPAVMACVPVSW